MKRYAISDIHGCVRTFGLLLNKIALSKEDELYLLGDFIDRGPDSKGVFDRIIQLQTLGYKIHCLRGNHEEMMLQAMQKNRNYEHMWWMNGGMETLNSFNVSTIDEVPSVYIKFIKSLKYFVKIEDYIFAHAGLNFKSLDPLEDIRSMLWIRDWYKDINTQWLGDRIIVHGHTPIPESRVRQHVQDVNKLPAINIDNGCVYSREHHNQLCALDLDTLELVFQKNVDFL